MLTKKQWEFCLEEFGKMFPDAHCELVHENPFELTCSNIAFRSMYGRTREPGDGGAVSRNIKHLKIIWL